MDDSILEALNGKSLLVTGATGLIGGALVDKLITSDYAIQVYAAGRNINKGRFLCEKYDGNDRFHFIPFDVTEPLQSNIEFDYIIHCAGNAGPSYFKEKPVEVMTANLCGVINLVDYGLNHKMKRFLYISSGEVYGNGGEQKWKEDNFGLLDFLNPRSCYPSAKRACESLCKSYGIEYGIDFVIARLCHIYGPNFAENEDRVFAQFINEAISKGTITIKSSGLQNRSWLYIDDCISAILTLIIKGKSGEAYNIADEDGEVSIRGLAEIIADNSGVRIVSENQSTEEKEYNWSSRKSLYDTEKIRSLGWSPQYSLSQGVAITLSERIKREKK